MYYIYIVEESFLYLQNLVNQNEVWSKTTLSYVSQLDIYATQGGIDNIYIHSNFLQMHKLLTYIEKMKNSTNFRNSTRNYLQGPWNSFDTQVVKILLAEILRSLWHFNDITRVNVAARNRVNVIAVCPCLRIRKANI